jgi:hypothetical protein
MLAEIFMLRLEAQSRANQPNGSATTASDTRFVPIVLPRR